METDVLSDILRRLERIEQAVFKTGRELPRQTAENADEYNGLAGGVRLLVSAGFFDEKRGLSDVRSALSSRGYHYSSKAIDTALTRSAGISGPLVSFKESGRKVYATRR